MNSKERIQQAFACKSVDRVPWVPFVGCHAAALQGQTATDYLQSSDNIVQGVSEAINRYQPDGIPVMFDLQIEAEVLGCQLQWSDENPPAVTSHPLTNGTCLDDLIVPQAEQGRIKTALDATRQLRVQHPDIALYGLITGPFTLALHLQGTDIFMQMFDNPQGVHDLLAFCQKTAKAMARYYIEAGCDVIAAVDPMTSQISPDQFKEFVTPYASAVFSSIREQGALSSFFVCGHAQQNIGVMCDCRPDNVSIDENIPLDFVREECTKRGISFGGNMQLTRVLLLGNTVDAQQNAIHCLEVGGEAGFILAPGCDIPYHTPVDNIRAVTEVVQDPYKREIAQTLSSPATDEEHLDLEDYGQSDKVIVDIITLDSEACAPCQYMVDAVQRVVPEFDGIVEWREHKIKSQKSLQFMMGLMVHNVPTICIDGQIVFVSRIPPKDELIAAIQKRINEKMRLRITQRKATVHVLGETSADVDATMVRLDQAVRELGVDVNIERVTSPEAIAGFGVNPTQTPAIVITEHSLKSVRRVPETVVIKEWLKSSA